MPAPTAYDQTLAAQAPVPPRPRRRVTRQLDAAIESHFATAPSKRIYVMTDKPLYQPGETLYYRADVRATGTLIGQATGLTMQLVSPRGAVAAQHRVFAKDGIATSAFDLPAEIDGGEYTLRLTGDDGSHDDHKVVINTYEAPRMQKTIEFVKKAYGAHDTVTAAIEVRLATGEPLANKPIVAVATLDDGEIARLSLTTDASGHAIAKFPLPPQIGAGDGLLSVLVDAGGVTEAMQKRIPILTNKLGFAAFPEGGDLVEGVPGRVYFSATNALGKPADIEGRVVDDRGVEVAKLASIHDGMGRFEITPAVDRTYHVEITRPENIAAHYDLPAARDGGCVLRAIEDTTNTPPVGGGDTLKVAATCTATRVVAIEAVMRDKRVAGGDFDVTAGKPAVVELPIDGNDEGAVRVTLLSQKKEPLAERVMFHGRGRDMKVAIEADRKSYGPRDPVTLHVHTTDADGKPVAANVGVAVVDDTVLTFADDKSARILAHMYLDAEMPAGLRDRGAQLLLLAEAGGDGGARRAARHQGLSQVRVGAGAEPAAGGRREPVPEMMALEEDEPADMARGMANAAPPQRCRRRRLPPRRPRRRSRITRRRGR